MMQTKLPKVMIEEGEAVGLSLSDDPADLVVLKCEDLPVLVTLACFGDCVVVSDPCLAEEACADCLVSVAVDSRKRIVLTHKHHSALNTAVVRAISAETLESAVSVAIATSLPLISETTPPRTPVPMEEVAA